MSGKVEATADNFAVKEKGSIPVVYSCSGCSNVAQLTNSLALKLNKDGIAEMSCITGVGGGVKPLVHKAKNASSIIVLDGCPLKCALLCLENQNIRPKHHYVMTEEFNLKKKQNEEFSADETAEIYNLLLDRLIDAEIKAR